MPPDSRSDVKFEIGHVLFIDIVGYSKLLISEQSNQVQTLRQLVRGTEQFKTAEAEGKLLRLPTGDGGALVFRNSPEAPVLCALEISKALKSHPELRVRMGIHSGPVNEITDLNEQANIAGAGINIAQRVMDCGDAGHILLSKRVADDLEQYEHWRRLLHKLGSCEVKHGVRIDIANLHSDEVGNPELPKRFQALKKHRSRVRWAEAAIALLVLAAVVAAFIFVSRKPTRGVLSVAEKSIAVLPFENLSEEKENAFFADGIQDDILTSLGKIADLKVISRTSVMQYRGAGAAHNLRDIGHALGVENVLEGTVRRTGNRVLVNVQLIDATNDRHIWAERYDRTITDSIGLQGELATEIATILKAKLDPQVKTTLGTKPTTNPEAYVLYLRGLALEQDADTLDDFKAVNQLYAQALALDPTFALAQARASIIYSQQFFKTHDAALKAKARTLADEALRLSPVLGEGHLALGLYFFLTEGNYNAALEEFSTALTFLPNNVEALMHIARIYRRQGRWREAIAGFEHARSLDPLTDPARLELVRTYWMVRDWRSATAAMKRNLEGGFPLPIIGLAQIEVVANCDLGAARAQLREIPAGVDPDGEVTLANWNLSMLERDWAAAEKWLADFPSDAFPDAGPKSYYQAQTALARGDIELARTLFEKGRPALENDVRNHPDDPTQHAALGILYGYIGRKEDAIRESRRAVELCPESTDAMNGVPFASELALVYALTGEIDQAVTLIERLLQTPAATMRRAFYEGGITQAELRLRWQWDKLRGNPRFQKILNGPEPKTIY